MAITPSGSPAWLRVAAHTDYGGNVNKTNYLSRGVIDALTDMGAEALVRMAADLEAIVRTCPFATITYLNNDSSPAAPTIEVVFMMTGVRTISYVGTSPPTGFPSAARNGAGDVTFTFASTYNDPYGVAGAFAPQQACAGVHGTTAGDAPVVISGQTVRVRCLSGGVAINDKRVTLEVW